MSRDRLSVLVLTAVMSWNASLVADVGGPDPVSTDDEPNPECYDGSSLLEGFMCEECDGKECKYIWEQKGYSFVCDAGWNSQLWCCGETDAGACDPLVAVPTISSIPPDGGGDGMSYGTSGYGACVVSPRRQRELPAQLALVAALIGLGLFVRSRSRS